MLRGTFEFKPRYNPRKAFYPNILLATSDDSNPEIGDNDKRDEPEDNRQGNEDQGIKTPTDDSPPSTDEKEEKSEGEKDGNGEEGQEESPRETKADEQESPKNGQDGAAVEEQVPAPPEKANIANSADENNPQGGEEASTTEGGGGPEVDTTEYNAKGGGTDPTDNREPVQFKTNVNQGKDTPSGENNFKCAPQIENIRATTDKGDDVPEKEESTTERDSVTTAHNGDTGTEEKEENKTGENEGVPDEEGTAAKDEEHSTKDDNGDKGGEEGDTKTKDEAVAEKEDGRSDTNEGAPETKESPTEKNYTDGKSEDVTDTGNVTKEGDGNANEAVTENEDDEKEEHADENHTENPETNEVVPVNDDAEAEKTTKEPNDEKVPEKIVSKPKEEKDQFFMVEFQQHGGHDFKNTTSHRHKASDEEQHKHHGKEEGGHDHEQEQEHNHSKVLQKNNAYDSDKHGFRDSNQKHQSEANKHHQSGHFEKKDNQDQGYWSKDTDQNKFRVHKDHDFVTTKGDDRLRANFGGDKIPIIEIFQSIPNVDYTKYSNGVEQISEPPQTHVTFTTPNHFSVGVDPNPARVESRPQEIPATTTDLPITSHPLLRFTTLESSTIYPPDSFLHGAPELIATKYPTTTPQDHLSVKIPHQLTESLPTTMSPQIPNPSIKDNHPPTIPANQEQFSTTTASSEIVDQLDKLKDDQHKELEKNRGAADHLLKKQKHELAQDIQGFKPGSKVIFGATASDEKHQQQLDWQDYQQQLFYPKPSPKPIRFPSFVTVEEGKRKPPILVEDVDYQLPDRPNLPAEEKPLYEGERPNHEGDLTNLGGTQFVPPIPNVYGVIRPNVYEGEQTNTYEVTRPNIYEGEQTNINVKRPNIYEGDQPNIYEGARPHFYASSQPNFYEGNKPSFYDDHFAQPHRGFSRDFA